MGWLNRLQLVILGFLSVAASLGQARPPALLFPQIADGGGIRFEVSLTNPGTRPDSGEIQFKDGSGQPLSIVVNGVAFSSIPYMISAGGAFRVQSDGAGDLKTGYALIVSDSDVAFVSGSIVYDLNGKVSVPGVVIGRAFHSFVERDSENNSGIAVANSANKAIQIEAVLLREDGSVAGNRNIDLAAGQQSPRFIDRIFDSLDPNFRGSLHLKSEDDFAAVALKQDTQGALTTLAGAQVAFPALGFAAAISEEVLQQALAVNEAGEKLIVLGGPGPLGQGDPVQGAIWIGRGGGSVTALLGQDRLPTTAFSDNFILLFENYTANTVDVGIIDPSGQTQIVREVEVDPEDIVPLSTTNPSEGSAGVAGARSNLWDVLRMGGQLIGSVACTVELAKTGGLVAPVLFPICKSTGASLALTLASLVAADNSLIQESEAAFASIGCATGLGNDSPAEAVSSCTRLVSSRGTQIAGEVGQERAARQDEIDMLRTSLNCQYSVAPELESFTASGGTENFLISTAPACPWEIQVNSNFITVTDPVGRTGMGETTVSYSVDSNSTANSRVGILDIQGETFTVTQEGVSCSFSIDPTSRNHSSDAESGTVSVTAPVGCDWEAMNNDPWISITSAGNGDGDGTVTYAVEANESTSPREGTLTVAGQTFTVSQAGMEIPVCAPAPSGLISWWPGDENANDIADGNNGVPGGDATFAPGWVDSAFSFSGAGEVLVTDNANLNPQNVTVEAWINTSSTPTSQPSFIAAKSGPGGDFGYELLINPASDTQPGRARFVILRGSREEGMLGNISAGPDLTDGQFHHIVGTRDGTGTKLYVDGKLEIADFNFHPIDYVVGPFYIGRREQSGSPGPFTGILDEVSVYDRALTASEVEGIFDAGALGKCKP